MPQKLQLQNQWLQKNGKRVGLTYTYQMIVTSIYHYLSYHTLYSLQLKSMNNQELQNDNFQDNAINNYNKNIIREYFRKAKVTSIALIVIWVMFAIECILSWSQTKTMSRIDPYVLVDLGGNVPIMVQEGQVYRLVLAMILHGGALHIFMNTMSLIGFCAVVQSLFNTRLYFIVYVFGGIQGNMLSAWYNLRYGNESIVGIGASTSICAVMGLYIANVICLSKKNQNVDGSRQSIIRMIGSLFILSLIPGVDFFGHFGSLFSGILLGLTLIPGEDKQLTILKRIGTVLLVIYTMILLTIFI